MWRTWWSTVLGEIDSRHLLLGAAAADQTQHLDFAVAEPGRPGGAGRSGDMAVDGAREGPPEEIRVRLEYRDLGGRWWTTTGRARARYELYGEVLDGELLVLDQAEHAARIEKPEI